MAIRHWRWYDAVTGPALRIPNELEECFPRIALSEAQRRSLAAERLAAKVVTAPVENFIKLEPTAKAVGPRWPRSAARRSFGGYGIGAETLLARPSTPPGHTKTPFRLLTLRSLARFSHGLI
ncbi:hypothetical protein GCM10009562_38400 [Nocardioides aquaticus]